MESGIPLFIFTNKTGSIIIYHPLIDFEDLPYPLYLAYHWKCLITILHVIALAFGFKLRWIIFKYLTSPESNGPLNRLIWMDQINGLFFGTVLMIKIFAINCPNALSELLGDTFCVFFDLLGTTFVAGSVIWTCFIAFFRIAFIKAQNWVKLYIGEIALLNLFLAMGVILNLVLAALIATFDSKSAGKKICRHLSSQEIKILQQYQVILVFIDYTINTRQ
jgi:hypothetical protein